MTNISSMRAIRFLALGAKLILTLTGAFSLLVLGRKLSSCGNGTYIVLFLLAALSWVVTSDIQVRFLSAAGAQIPSGKLASVFWRCLRLALLAVGLFLQLLLLPLGVFFLLHSSQIVAGVIDFPLDLISLVGWALVFVPKPSPSKHRSAENTGVT